MGNHFQHLRSRSQKMKPAMQSMDTRKSFEMLCGAVIFANAIIAGVGADFAIKNPRLDPPVFLARCETFFVIFYTLEIGLRMHDQRRAYITGRDKWWNMFDVVLVIQGMAEQIQMVISAPSDGGFANIS